MTKSECLALFGITDLLDLPSAVARVVLSPDKERRNEVYKQLLKLNNYDMGVDWFQELYEAELSQRKQNKQDFTPNAVGRLASLITGLPTGTIHEPTAGNGSMVIADWWNRCQRVTPFEFFPSENMYTAWELSDRAVPLLLLNLSIRGIMGCVYHGDVLERRIINRYILLNPTDDALGFSDIIKDPDCKLKITES